MAAPVESGSDDCEEPKPQPPSPFCAPRSHAPPRETPLDEPAGTTPVAVLEQVLAEHGLRAKPVGNDTFAIVREPVAVADTGEPVPKAAAILLEEIVIAASRYSLASDVPAVHTFLTQEQIEGLPRLADDSLKAVQRLPGAASNGLSGLANMRGGESNETLIVFDGLPLYDPFHLRLLRTQS